MVMLPNGLIIESFSHKILRRFIFGNGVLKKNTLEKFLGAITVFIKQTPGIMLVLPVSLAGLMIYRSSPKVREIFDNTVMPKIKDLCTFLGRCYECLIPISNALQLKK